MYNFGVDEKKNNNNSGRAIIIRGYTYYAFIFNRTAFLYIFNTTIDIIILYSVSHIEGTLTGFHLFSEFRNSVFRQRLQSWRCPRHVVGGQQRAAHWHVYRTAELYRNMLKYYEFFQIYILRSTL